MPDTGWSLPHWQGMEYSAHSRILAACKLSVCIYAIYQNDQSFCWYNQTLEIFWSLSLCRPSKILFMKIRGDSGTGSAWSNGQQLESKTISFSPYKWEHMLHVNEAGWWASGKTHTGLHALAQGEVHTGYSNFPPQAAQEGQGKRETGCMDWAWVGVELPGPVWATTYPSFRSWSANMGTGGLAQAASFMHILIGPGWSVV